MSGQEQQGKQTMGQHTPRPWTHWSARPHGVLFEVTVGSCEFGAQPALAVGRTMEEADANAALIVRAVNAHDSLVAAVQAGINALEPFAEGENDDNPLCVVLKKMEAALALATDGGRG